jgi:hypothetical protein
MVSDEGATLHVAGVVELKLMTALQVAGAPHTDEMVDALKIMSVPSFDALVIMRT